MMQISGKYKTIAVISAVLGVLCLGTSSYFGGTMFGYVNTESAIVYRLQHLYPLTYCFGAIVIYCSWRMDSRLFAVIGLLEMLFIPLLLGLVLQS